MQLTSELKDEFSRPIKTESYSEEMADGALEMLETAYATIPCYRDGWAHIHEQDQEDWLATFGFLKEPLASIEAWARAGRLTSAQARRHEVLQLLMGQLDPVLAELEVSSHLSVGRFAGAHADEEFDLL